MENFTLFSEHKAGLVKVIGQNHQYLGVNNAIASMLAARQRGHGRAGVYWQTQGSGKSFSMVFFAQKVLRKVPGNWTFVVVTDRVDLDDQIAKTFKAAGAVGEAEGDQCHAMQTIARANRVFPGKHSGVIVDYANVFASLEKALAIYGTGRGGERPVRDKAKLVEELSTEERTEVKKVARDLLSRVKELLVINWRQKASARSQVKLAIEDVLDTGLPRVYSPEVYRQKCGVVFEHFYEGYPERDGSGYVSAA